MSPTLMRRILAFAGLALCLVLLAEAGSTVLAQTNEQGQWRTLSYSMPINPVHMALMNNGKVLIVAGSGNLPTETNFEAAVWDPSADTIVPAATRGGICSATACRSLLDGRVFVNGGNLKYDPFWGERRSASFDPGAAPSPICRTWRMDGGTRR